MYKLPLKWGKSTKSEPVARNLPILYYKFNNLEIITLCISKINELKKEKETEFECNLIIKPQNQDF